MLSATDFDERVDVLAESVTKDEYAEEETSYEVDRTVWADVKVRSGSERRIGGQPEERATVLIRARKAEMDGVTRDSRVRYDGEDLRVHARRMIGTHDRYVELETTRTR